MDIKKIISNQKEAYLPNFLENKDKSEGTFQNNRVTQHLRFNKILEPFKDLFNTPLTFHEVGCGSGDMYQYMQDQGISWDYSGTEIIDEMIG